MSLCSVAVPNVHITSRVARASRSRVFGFFSDHFLPYMLATMTAIRVAHNDSSIFSSQIERSALSCQPLAQQNRQIIASFAMT